MNRLLLWGVCVLAGACAPRGKGFYGFPVEHRDRVTLPGMTEITLLYMGYVHCPDVCPIVMAKLRQAVEALPEDLRSRVRVILVSVNPEEGPEEVARYARSFHPDFVGLALPDSTRENLAHQLGAMALPAGEGYMEHMAAVYLLQDGIPRLLYTPEFHPDSLAEDLRSLNRRGPLHIPGRYFSKFFHPRSSPSWSR